MRCCLRKHISPHWKELEFPKRQRRSKKPLRYLCAFTLPFQLNQSDTAGEAYIPAPFKHIYFLCWLGVGRQNSAPMLKAALKPAGSRSDQAQPHCTPAITKPTVRTRNPSTNTNPSHGSQYFWAGTCKKLFNLCQGRQEYPPSSRLQRSEHHMENQALVSSNDFSHTGTNLQTYFM